MWPKKFVGLLFVLLFSLHTFAPDVYGKSVVGEGRFNADEEDSLGFVKSQLIYLAFRDVLTKEMDAMGLDSDLFWERYNQEFMKTFEPIEKDLQEKFDVGEKKQTWEEKRRYKSLLRKKKIKLLQRFGNIQKVVRRYSIKTMSRSPQYPRSRFILLSATVDRTLLHELYRRYMAGEHQRQVNKLYVSLKLNLKGADWSKLGVDYEKEFTDVIKEHWRKWLLEDFGYDSNQVEATSVNLEERLADHLRVSDIALDNMELMEDSSSKAVSSFSDSLWLKINVNVNWLGDNPLLRYREFEIDSDLLLIDLKNNRPIYFQEYPLEANRYSYQEIQKMTSEIASFIYRNPISDFRKFKSIVQTLPTDVTFRRITISNSAHFSELLEIQKLIESKGIKFQMVVDIRSMSKEKSLLKVEFKGVEAQIAKILMELDGKRLKNGKKVRMPNKDNPFFIKLEGEISSRSNGKV